jgi:putative membrane protein
MARSLFARLRVAGFVTVAGVSACSLLRRGSGDSPPATSAQSPAPKPKIKLEDRDVAAIFLAANNTDVSYAQVALTPGRTSNTEVIAFANRMLSDHGGLNRSALELFANANISPRDNTISLDFRDESAAKRDTLRERNGAQFDSTYMANEVRYHSRLLVAIDSLLLPSTKDAQLRTMLTRVRPAVAAHLEHATRVQAGLGK